MKLGVRFMFFLEYLFLSSQRLFSHYATSSRWRSWRPLSCLVHKIVHYYVVVGLDPSISTAYTVYHRKSYISPMWFGISSQPNFILNHHHLLRQLRWATLTMLKAQVRGRDFGGGRLLLAGHRKLINGAPPIFFTYFLQVSYYNCPN
jgi:hypothetical protein